MYILYCLIYITRYHHKTILELLLSANQQNMRFMRDVIKSSESLQL